MSRFGVFGKIPARDDFIRRGLDGAGVAFDRWLRRALEAIRKGGEPLPDFALRCFIPFHDDAELIAAFITPSRDGVGRRYPLVIFERIALDALDGAFAALPVAAGPFFRAAAALAEAAAMLPPEAVFARLGALPKTSEVSLARARVICDRTLAVEPAVDFEERAFDDPSSERCYGYSTLLSAAAPLIGKPSAKPGPLLDCPIQVDIDQFAWLELMERVLAWPASLPGILWCEDPEPRMFVSLGSMPEKALACFVSSQQAARLLWPLTTDRAEARDDASARLGPALGAAIPADAPLGALIEALARLTPTYVT